MNKHDKSDSAKAAMARHFGPLSLVMLEETELRHAWRVNFLANFFTGPAYRQIDEQFALTRPEFVILYCLSYAPGLTARDICLVTGLPKNSISRAVSDLLEKGLVERKAGLKDKRAKPIFLTKEGLSALQKIVPLFEARQENMRRVLTEDEQVEFDRLLQKIVYAMPEWASLE